MADMILDGAKKPCDGEQRQSSGITIPDPHSITEHGRTFNAYREGRYFLPNDGTEQSRLGTTAPTAPVGTIDYKIITSTWLDLQHRVWRLAMDDALAWAPINDIELSNVLDIGTGTGAWAIDFAESHPEAQVFGVDISQIQPLYVPPNCQFVREDSEEEWVFGFSFDYIHLRMMATCFSDYEGMVKKVFDHLRPGGWVEYQEFTLEATSNDKHSQHVLRNDPASHQGLLNRLKEGFLMLGRDVDVTHRTKGWLKEAGFVDVVEKRFSVPITPWSSDPKEKEIGHLQAKNWHIGIESAIKALYATLPPEDIEMYIEACQNNLKVADLKIYHTWSVVYGRKPHLGESKT